MSEHNSITTDEVLGWFKAGHRKPRLSIEQCADLARRLNSLRWAGDDLEWSDAEYNAALAKALPGAVLKHSKPDTERWWMFQEGQNAIKAAKLLQAILPKMLAHWESMTPVPATEPGHPEISAGPPALKALADALNAALPYIELPFGVYERRAPKQRPRTKKWHSAALVVAHHVRSALIGAKHENPGIGKKSAVALITAQVLRRMDFNVGDAAVGVYLDRAKTSADEEAKEAEEAMAKAGFPTKPVSPT